MICNSLIYITLATFTIAFTLDLIATIRQAWQSAALTAVTPAPRESRRHIPHRHTRDPLGDPWLAAMSELVENNPQP